MANPRQEPRQETQGREGRSEERPMQPGQPGAQAAQAAQDTARKASEETERVAQTAAEAGERVARASADLMQSNAQAMQRAWQSGTNFATLCAERSADQFARALGMSGNGTQEATQQSSRNVEAIMQSSAALAQGMQTLSNEIMEFARHRLEKNIDQINEIMRSRTPHDFTAAQSNLLRDNLEGMLQTGRRVAEMSVRMTDEAVHRMTQSPGTRSAA